MVDIAVQPFGAQDNHSDVARLHGLDLDIVTCIHRTDGLSDLWSWVRTKCIILADLCGL
jgi:hypothetical protein